MKPPRSMDYIKQLNFESLVFQRKKKKARSLENLFKEVLDENNFLSLARHVVIQIQEAQRLTTGKHIAKGLHRDHIVIRLLKVSVKEKILKSTREKHLVTYKGSSIRQTTDILSR